MKKALLLSLLLVACDGDAPPVSTSMTGTLQIEVLDTADVIIEPTTGDAMRVTITSAAGFGLMPEATAVSADGRIETIPETGDTLYTAKIAGPADSSGPCGSDPVSLALSLHRQGKNAIVLGGISAYCGADTWYGVPTRVLRLSGPLPLP